MNTIQATHAFLMRRCDGNHHGRFVQCLSNTEYDPNTDRGRDAFNGMPYDEQIKYIVNFWALQLSNCGVTCTPESMNYNYRQASTNFESFMESIRPYIEDHQLPRMN